MSTVKDSSGHRVCGKRPPVPTHSGSTMRGAIRELIRPDDDDGRDLSQLAQNVEFGRPATPTSKRTYGSTLNLERTFTRDSQRISTVLDTIRGSANLPGYNAAEGLPDSPAADHKSLLPHIDRRLIPLLFLMALLQGFNKNVSHAKTMGMNKQLFINDNEWSTLLSTFYFGFIISTVLIISIAKSIGAYTLRWLTSAIVLSGVATASIALSTKFEVGNAYRWISFVRFLQGLSEGTFIAMTTTYLMQFYMPGQIAARMIYFFLVPSLSSALGALYASGIIRITSTYIRNWQCLYIGEGGLTVAIGLLAYFMLPGSTEDLKLSKMTLNLSGQEFGKEVDFAEEKVAPKQIIGLLKNSSAAIWLLIDVCLGVPMTLILLYLPQVIIRIGFTPNLANILTTFPYLLPIVLTIFALPRVNPGQADTWVIGLFGLQFVGFLLYRLTFLGEHTYLKAIAYCATFLMASGVGTTNILAAKYFGPMVEIDEQRLILNTMGIILINASGVLTSWVFRAQNFHADVMTIGFVAFGTLVCFLHLILGHQGRKRISEKALETVKL